MVSKAEKKSSSGRGMWVNVAIAIVALAGAIAIQQTRLQNPRLDALDPQQAEKQEALELELLARSPSFGFDNLIADWVFLQWVQYFGDEELRNQTGYGLNDDYFDLITRRDPRFRQMYPFISTAVSFTQGEPETAIKFMERGTEALSPEIDPQAYLVWRFKGLDQLLLLGDIEGSVYSHEMAAKWAQAVGEEQTAAFYQEAADFLRSDPDSTSVRLWAWNEVYRAAINETVKHRAEREMQKLGAEKRTTEGGQVIFVLPPSDRKESSP